MPTSAANPLLPLRLSEGQIVVHNPATRSATAAIQTLTGGLARGEEAAFREFHEIYFHRLYAFLLVICRGHEQEAQDALQETLARVVRHARVFDNEEIFWSWVKALARNAARDRNRKQRRYVALLQKFAIRLALFTPPCAGDGEVRLTDVLEECLEELSAGDRHLIEGKYIEGETVRELAANAHATEKAIESRLARLRLQLRENLLKKLRQL